MELISIYLASNRGSYEGDGPVSGEFELLEYGVLAPPNPPFIQNGNWQDLQTFIDRYRDKYIFGFISYDTGFQNIENRLPQKSSLSSIPASYLVAIDKADLRSDKKPVIAHKSLAPVFLKQLVSKTEYHSTVNQLKNHIQQGDIYEINYCIPFVAHNVMIDPVQIFNRLNEITPMPFSALIDTDEFAIISASPERFIKKKKGHLIIQPMKGTKARNTGSEAEDKIALQNDPKERSENVMIVDLTRNDLSKLAKKGSVKVDELFGVYTFPSILQMISTVSCEIDPDENLSTIFSATFPMGSMTGAPKKRAMQLIDEYECFARGPFSGTLGYITPDGDFDFSVLIRTIFYDKVNRKLFIGVGSAITSKSNVEKEYEECLIKLQPLLNALNATIT